jgi:4-hydroxyphenylpyruvate dioxygenase-like putative hemolysin
MTQPKTATQPTTALHHVVFAIAAERLDTAVEFLASLGFEFQDFELEHLGLQIRLDWDRGFELISPTPAAPNDPGSAAEFLARCGDGLFSVVVRVADADAATDIARRYGTKPDFEQAMDDGGFELKEVKLEPFCGIPLTLLQTNLP